MTRSVAMPSYLGMLSLGIFTATLLLADCMKISSAKNVSS